MLEIVHTGRQKLRDILSVKTSYKVCGNTSLPKQSWLQLIYCTICLPYGHNFGK